MAKIDKDKFGHLGADYQARLLAQILSDRMFANSILDIIDPNYFEDTWTRMIVAAIKEAKKEDAIPDIGSLEFRLLQEIDDDYQRKYVLQQLKIIRDANLNDSLAVQEIAMKFCKHQEIKKSLKEVQKIVDKGDFRNFEQIETIWRKALEHGDNKDDGLDVFDDIENVLAEDFRNPIRTGIKGLDDIMNGGLSKGELAVILAPFGVGKTTMITKIANTAMLDGKKVLQIFFEDLPKVIQRKHLACWTGIELNELSEHKDEILKKCEEMQLSSKDGKGILKLKKFSSDGTTIPMIRQYIRKLIAQGFRPDIILLDYIDCVQPSSHYDDVNIGEGTVMRQFETMLYELDLAGWTAVQGNRSSINSDVVQADQMSGSIKKGMIGHFIVSIAKSLDQKNDGTATMAILKSRFGKDGKVFENITFDNARIQIEMGQNIKGKSQKEYKIDNEIKGQERVNFLLEARNSKANAFNGPTENVGDNTITSN